MTKHLNDDVIEPIREDLTGVVAELAGILSGTPQIGDAEDEYTDYLVRKYGREAATE